jgi:methylenetetrahydrofolate reductase (NADPH)
MMRNMRWPLLSRLSPTAHRPASPAVRSVVANTVYELVPLKNLEGQLPHLPSGSHVSVTCSPAKGIEATLDLAARLKGDGLLPTPHIAARLVRDRSHLREIAARVADAGFDELFLIAGDEETPAGAYHDGAAVLEHLLEERHGLRRIGVPAYPDGHLFISREALHHALHHKQNLLHQAGVDGWASTQMCFDPTAIASWLSPERRAGLTLPVRLGIPGPIDRTKLLTMGMRVGVGQSLRYLQKNRAGLTKLITGTAYDPTKLLGSLADQLQPLHITGLHLFTFNQLEASVAWQQGVLGTPTPA